MNDLASFFFDKSSQTERINVERVIWNTHFDFSTIALPLLPNHSGAVLYLFYGCIEILQCVNKIFNLPIQALCFELHQSLHLLFDTKTELEMCLGYLQNKFICLSSFA